ncbi:MAG: addA [Erysipelotrichaceae bacterium]|nr:MAG: addA [Erysipelotrichaceae bacterium]
MTIKWSEKQEAAIEILDTNVLVSASAGAGKTTVLIGRLMKRMERDHVELSEIIAMTFTELAAMEMRKRLLKELTKRINELDDMNENKRFLQKQVVLLPSAQISTIHSFCLSLIQKYSYVLKEDPALSQNILDEAQKSLLMDETFNELFETWSFKHKEAMYDLLLHFDPRPESKAVLRENVYRLSGKLSTLIQPKAWLKQSFLSMDTRSFKDMSDHLKSYVIMYYQWKIEDLISKAEIIERRMPNEVEYRNFLDDKGRDKILYVTNEVGSIRVKLVHLMKQFNHFDYLTFRKEVIDLHLEKFTSYPKIKTFPKIEIYATALKKGYDSLLAELYDEDEWFKDLPIIKARMETMAAFTEEFGVRYRQLKIDEKVMDFDDMEYYALRILKDEDFKVSDDFKRRYKEIMVDEFQDTNYVQNEIVELISNGKNIFRVGDVKQSIYRFRNAEPSMMQDMIVNTKEGNKTLYLDQNYRSKLSIVDFNNDLFTILMNFPELPSRYAFEDRVTIGNIAKQTGGPKVELHLLDLEIEEEVIDELDENEESEVDFSDSQDYAPDNLEEIKIEPDPYNENESLADPKAKHITNQIRALMASNNGYKFSDFVILVRTNDFKVRMKRIFEETGIPHQISVKTGFFNSNAVQDVLLVINYLINPHDNINFVGLCLSAFVGLDETECAKLRIENINYESYYTTFTRCYPDLFKKLSQFESECHDLGLLDILRLIYGLNSYYDQKCSKQQRANLDLLFEKALMFDEENLSLSEFLLLLKRVKDEDSGEAIPFTEEDNVVRVMTIHQSKGLEFKVVFYWSQGKIQVKDNKAPLLMDSKLGFVFNTIRHPYRIHIKNPVRKALEMKSSLDDVMEQLRVLYVALTRAEDKLIIVDIKPKFETTRFYTSILNSLGPTNWILMALKGNQNIIIKDFPKPSDPIISPKLEDKDTSIVIAEKSKDAIVFKTPSSKHTKFTHFKLNFDTNIGSNHGTLIHELFEKLPKDGVTEEQIKTLSPDIKDKDIQSILAFYTNPIYAKIAKGEIHHEFPFYALLGTEVIHGYMDMVAFTSEETILIDFKTDRVDSKEVLLELYTDQLRDYVRVLQQMRPNKPVKAYMYSLALKSYVEVH